MISKKKSSSKKKKIAIGAAGAVVVHETLRKPILSHTYRPMKRTSSSINLENKIRQHGFRNINEAKAVARYVEDSKIDRHNPIKAYKRIAIVHDYFGSRHPLLIKKTGIEKVGIVPFANVYYLLRYEGMFHSGNKIKKSLRLKVGIDHNVNTIFHEYKHALDFKREKRTFKEFRKKYGKHTHDVYEQLKKERNPQTLKDHLDLIHEAYMKNPYEVSARKFGEAGASAFSKSKLKYTSLPETLRKELKLLARIK